MTRILIAEGEARITSFLEKGLRAEGYSIVVTAERKEAVRLGRSGRFSLLLLDLPDGPAVVHELRAAGTSLPVLILSAARRGDEDALGAGAPDVEYVTKPFGFVELLERIRLMVSERSPAPPPPSWRRA